MSRSLLRDVFIYDLRNLDSLLGGLTATPGITNANFYTMVEIIIVTSSPFFLQNNNREEVLQDAQPLSPGNYFVVVDGTVQLSDEIVYVRLMSVCTGSGVGSFTRQVRERDGGCVVSKVANTLAMADLWKGFEAAHIFPIEYHNQWQENNFGRWIDVPPARGGSINSVQNGILLRADLHQQFDSYIFSINPDDGYKIVFFHNAINRDLAGTFLDSELLDDRRCPPPELVRWHFRQAVLTNMRGAGEPVFEHDFPPGSDMLRDIREGPMAAERMEFELFGRLASYVDGVGEGGVGDEDESEGDEYSSGHDEDDSDNDVTSKG
ncbi:hypothetical protein RJ55_02847 [Drechmeria coniospora]|nr:hypothetical protein RJ55_02847 [Drechmeria coniospora]